MSHGSCQDRREEGRGAVLDISPDCQGSIIDSFFGRKQSPCGRHQLVGLHLYGHPLCLLLWHKFFLQATQNADRVSPFSPKKYWKILLTAFSLSQSPTSYLAGNVLYGGALSSEVKSGI